MITSKKRLNLGFRRDQTTHLKLPRTSQSLPTLNENLKNLPIRPKRSNPCPNTRKLSQQTKFQPKYLVSDHDKTLQSKQRHSSSRFTTYSPGFITSTTPENWPSPILTKRSQSTSSAASPWQRKKSATIVFSKSVAPMKT